MTIEKIEQITSFLETCKAQTQRLHEPIINLEAVNGHLNPAGLGNARKFSGWNPGQSTVGYRDQDGFAEADDKGISVYGGAEYAIVRSAEAAAVGKKIARLHGADDAVVLSNGSAAISNIFLTILRLEKRLSLAISDNAYFPAKRALEMLAEFSSDIKIYVYPSDASKQDVKNLFQKAKHEGHPINLVYAEAPGSQTFEIADLDGIFSIAQEENVMVSFDNTYSSHIRLKPLERWNNKKLTVIQATTKYEGGYADTPSGVLIARHAKDCNDLAGTTRILGSGAISPQTCNRLYYRVDSTEKRLNQSHQNALKLIEWFKKQDFVADILCPFIEQSPYNDKAKDYFGKGNGLFTIVFKPGISDATITQFLNAHHLFPTGESWGGHISLCLKVHPGRALSKLPDGYMVRYYAGMEHGDDLIRDLEQSKQRVFGNRPQLLAPNF